MRNKWLTGEAIALTVGALVIVAAMLGLGWWQLQRALGGHTRSWVYAIQWPAFAAYACYLWWRLLHDQPAFGGRKRGAAEPSEAERAKREEEDRALAEYNEHLARLDAGRKPYGG